MPSQERSGALRIALGLTVLLLGALALAVFFVREGQDAARTVAGVLLPLLAGVAGYYFAGVRETRLAARVPAPSAAPDAAPEARDDPYRDAIAAARSRIDVLGVTLREVALRHQSHLEAAAARGVRIRLIAMDPDALANRFRPAEVGVDPETATLALRQTIRALLRSRLDVRLTSSPVPASYLRADDLVLVMPRFYGRTRRASEQLRLGAGSGLGVDYATQFEHLWRDARVPVEADATIRVDEEVDVLVTARKQDAAAAQALAEKLRRLGARVHCDTGGLDDGPKWFRFTEAALERRCVVVALAGEQGKGPWSRPERFRFLSDAVERGCRVLVVRLPDAPEDFAVPLFLSGATLLDGAEGEAELTRVLQEGRAASLPEVAGE